MKSINYIIETYSYLVCYNDDTYIQVNKIKKEKYIEISSNSRIFHVNFDNIVSFRVEYLFSVNEKQLVVYFKNDDYIKISLSEAGIRDFKIKLLLHEVNQLHI